MDVMGVPGGQGSTRVVPEDQGERQGCPRGSTRTVGVSGGKGGRQGGSGEASRYPRRPRGMSHGSREV